LKLTSKNYLTIAIIALILGSCAINKGNVSSGSKVNTHYKSLEAFNGDTILYTLFNFEENKDKYIGKKFSELYKDFELPILSYLPKRMYRQPDYAYGVDLQYHSSTRALGISSTKKDPLCSVIVKFENDYLIKELDDLREVKKGVTWNKAHAKYLKDFIIKDVMVYVNKVGRKTIENK